MIRIILFVLLIILAVSLWRWFVGSSAANVRNSLQRYLVVGLCVLALYLIATGRLAWVLPLIGGLLAVLARSLPHLLRFAPLLHRLWTRYRAGRVQPQTDNISSVETPYLRMRLDHDRGEINGEILQGRFQGRKLNDLELQDVMRFRNEVMHLDQDTLALIESYLDKIYPDDWRAADFKQGHKDRNRSMDDGQEMNRDEALEILGLGPDSSSREIIEAHRRLIQKIHPDRGGSDYLASKINRARDVLIGG